MSLSVLLISLLSSCHSHGGAQYECGPHGRFEYCIDGIPGCVVGCHCHPGYYFDTESKVCEPNTKLTQEYRRSYVPEPTRIQNLGYDQISSTILTPTVTNPVDTKIDEITKDADDIGDWLYSQFFKTIENQVINSTGDNEPVLTRRSGNPSKKKSKRKPRKHLKKSSKKPKRKKNGLKKKLLRITEDDSLFDSSSGSTSDEDTSSSSSESDTDTSSDADKTDKDHGHKKIIIFNKKPKPPLPSFIFLPNMDTPFYPPIGLPPPPVIPMYPFIPVPPVAPMLPGITESDVGATSTVPPITDSTSTTTTASTSVITTTAVTSAATESSSEPTTSTTPATDQSTTDKASLRAREPPFFGKMLKNKNKQRNKLLQKLKEKIKRRNKFPQLNSQPDDYVDIEEPLLENCPKPDCSRPIQSNGIEEDMPMEDVDFKYLTELIHRVDLNNTRKRTKLPFKPRTPHGGRRNYYEDPIYSPIPAQTHPINEQRRERIQKPDDTYYSNLGRQIATMIRKIDTDGNRQIDIEIEKENTQTPIHPVFNENSHASRSFWERSVRSPLKTYFEPRESKFTYLKHSNENLFNLENKVEVAVTTNMPLSLQEIENIINRMEQTQTNAKQTNDSTVSITSRKSLNPTATLISPQEPKGKYRVNNNMGPIKYLNLSPQDNRYRLQVNGHQTPTLSTLTPTIKRNVDKLLYHNKVPTRKPVQAINDNALRVQMMDYLKKLSNPPTTTKQPIIIPPSRMLYNRKNFKYFTNNNQYVYEKTSYPFYLSSIFKKINQPILSKPTKPSYFHHELHHFDYFDK